MVGGVGGEDGSATTTPGARTFCAPMTRAVASGTDASGVAWAMGAELAPASPARPREDDRAGEARVLPPPCPADGGVAPDEASGAPFSFFAAGTGLDKEYGRQASTTKQEAKRESSTYWSSLAGSSNLRPNLKPESRLLGSTSRGSGAGGASANRLGAGADPRGTSPVLSFFGIRGELSPPRSSPSS